MSNREAKAAMTTGKVFVKDAPTADAAREVEPADVSVRMNAPRARPWHDLVIIHRDSALAVVAKPAKMLSVPAHSRRGEITVIGAVRRALGEALAVHRIDEGTSGLMMVARTESSQTELKDMFFSHDVERRYIAVVAGEFPAEPVTHETVLVRDRGDGLRGSSGRIDGSSSDGKRAVSHFERLGPAGPNRSLVAAQLETGRTHQIRIHLSELGFPILGDRVYADRRVASATARLALHSHVLGFLHPQTGSTLRFEAPLADDLERIIRAASPPRQRP